MAFLQLDIPLHFSHIYSKKIKRIIVYYSKNRNNCRTVMKKLPKFSQPIYFLVNCIIANASFTNTKSLPAKKSSFDNTSFLKAIHLTTYFFDAKYVFRIIT